MALADYIEGLTIPQGRLAGEPFQLLSWQRRFLRGAFSQPGSAALSIARGNGKTTFLAAILAASVDVEGPLMQLNAEAVLVASSFEQARLAFAHVLRFLQPSIDLYGVGPRGRFRIEDSTARCRIQNKMTGASVKVLSSDPRRAHGSAPSLILMDELTQFPPSQLPAMLAALETSMGKIPDAKMLAIGTRPASQDHPFAVMLNGGAGYSQTHAAQEKDPPFHVRTWRRANPSLPIMPDLEAQIRREAELAKRDPDRLASFRALRLNMGTSDTSESFVFDPDKWAALEGDAPMVGSPVFGADLGSNASQSAIASFWPASGRLDVLAAFPRTPSLADRGIADGVGADFYESMARRGELLQLGEKISDVGQLLTAAYERFGVPLAIAADRWRVSELEEKLLIGGFPGCPLIERGQGFRDGAEDVRSFREALLTGRVTPTKSLLLRAAIREGRTISDPAANEKLSKGSQGGRRQKGRDDSLAAAILAVAIGYREASAAPRELEYAIV